ncbi:MAG: valine--tRNA ligase, partial [Bacteroidaceae bacterium]|nr:valine--tRNA ligase [Bacteroidaceae bacterium]
WQNIEERATGESIMFQPVSVIGKNADESLIKNFEVVKEIISGIRAIRLQKSIAPKEELILEVVGENKMSAFDAVIKKMANINAINPVSEKSQAAVAFMVGTTEYAVPLGNLMDVEAELKKLNDELAYAEGSLRIVMNKLNNANFVSRAPEAIVAAERKKQADAESRIASLKAAIAALQG